MHYGYWISLRTYKRLMAKRTIGGIAGTYADHSLLVVDKAFDQVVGCIPYVMTKKLFLITRAVHSPQDYAMWVRLCHILSILIGVVSRTTPKQKASTPKIGDEHKGVI